MISATWWTCRTIYIPVYSQYWFQNAVLNLITTRREFTVLQYSTALSSVITSFCIIFDICYMMNSSFRIYIFQNYSQYWFQHAVLNLITTRREFTLLHILQHSQASHNHIWYHYIYYSQYCICIYIIFQFYIYSRILPVLISTCCFEFNHYKTWIYSITVFYNTLKLNHIILHHIEPLRFIWYSRTTPFYISHHSVSMMILNYRSIYIPEYSQYGFQNAVLNLITTRREFTLFQYSTTLSSINHIILYHIWYLHMMKLPFYIYSRILPVWISKCCFDWI